jgi:hypothetical protein
MKTLLYFGEPGGDGAATQAVAGSPQAAIEATAQVRVQELEAANARLLTLVGELLVANQKLRERAAS